MDADLRAQIRGIAPLSVTDILGGVTQVAERAQEIAERAYESGNDAVALRAGDARLRALGMVADKLHLESSDVLEVLEGAQAVLNAVARFAQREPQLALELASRLDADDHQDIGDQLRQVVNRKALA